MSEHALTQIQATNTAKEPDGDAASLLRRDACQLESDGSLGRFFNFDDVYGTFMEPGLGHDFSAIPVHTTILQETNPSTETGSIFQQPPRKEGANADQCPTCPNEEPGKVNMSSEQTTKSSKSFKNATTPALSDKAIDSSEASGSASTPVFTEQAIKSSESDESFPTPISSESVPIVIPDVNMAESIAETTEHDAVTNFNLAENYGQALLVEDSAVKLASGQMKKSEFLSELRVEVTNTVEVALAGTERTAENCPYLNYWFDFYIRKDSRHIERAIRKYAPEASNVTTAVGYIFYIAQRVRQATEIWARTDKITGVPEGVPIDLPGEHPVQDDKGAGEAKNKPVLYKARQGGARKADDPQIIQRELGGGRPLENGIRSRMESAFGMDFSHVRTHTDGKAASFSNNYNARAFTVGEHIAFGAGEYRPGTLVGDTLIAHELAHVAQQSGAKDNEAPAHGDNSADYSMLENDADTAAAGIAAYLWGSAVGMLKDFTQNAVPRLRSGVRLQRCEQTRTEETLPPTSRILSIFAIPQTPPSNLVRPGAPMEAGPLHRPHGEYQEYIKWSTLNRDGFIVQEVTSTYNPTNCGTAAGITARPTPHFYEAWPVDRSGTVTPSLGDVNDAWLRPPNPGTEGDWSIDGHVYWVDTLHSSFGAGNVRDAGMLLSTTTEPPNLGPSLLGRRAGGRWDCSGTHTPI